MSEKVNNENSSKRRVRVKGKGLAVITYTPEVLISEYKSYIRKEVSRTLGMTWHFGHPDVEALYKFSDQPYNNPLLSLIHSNVSKGICYKAGDRLSFRAGVCEDEYTVEFRSVTVNGEEMLRAVVLELDGEYQSLPTADAVAAVTDLYQREQALFEEIDEGGDLL